MNLRPHQQEAVEKIVSAFRTHRSFLLADEVGLGKSRVACEVAKPFGNVLVVAPLSTIGGWLWEANQVNLPLGHYQDCGYCITNYERLEKYAHLKWDLLIFDECHRLKSYKTQRHKLWVQMHPKCYNLYLSATPAQNPLEMKYLCDIIGIPLSKYWSWVKSFDGITQPSWGGFAFRYGYKKDTEKLRGILNGPNSIRRTPDQILGWPELNRVINPIRISTDETRRYQTAFTDYQEKAQKAMSDQVQKLVAVGQFRQRISEIKLPYTLDLTESLLEQGKVVTIYCSYLASVNWLHEHLMKYRVASITGLTSYEDRQDILFKSKHDQLDVILFTVQEGINLHQIEDNHRERIQIDHDINWSAMQQWQTDGRTHRAGRSANVYWMACKDTIDERVGRVLKNKMESMEGMLQKYEIEPELLTISEDMLTFNNK